MARFSLNSYFALDAILNAPTLTDAARAVHLSQPAMSLALKKLRELFGDELVRYEHGRAELTPLAVQLRPQISEILRLSRAVLDQSRTFDPKVAARTLRIAAPDFVLAFLMPTLTAHLLLEAPGITLEGVSFPLAAGEAERVDLYVIPDWLASANETHFVLFREHIGCVCGVKNGVGIIDQDTYLALDHIAMPSGQEEQFWPDAHPARALLKKRNVIAVARNLNVLQQVIIERGLVATTFVRLVQQLAAYSPLIVARNAPAQFTPVTIVVQPAPGRGHEPAIVWLLQQLRLVAHRKIAGAVVDVPAK